MRGAGFMAPSLAPDCLSVPPLPRCCCFTAAPLALCFFAAPPLALCLFTAPPLALFFFTAPPMVPGCFTARRSALCCFMARRLALCCFKAPLLAPRFSSAGFLISSLGARAFQRIAQCLHRFLQLLDFIVRSAHRGLNAALLVPLLVFERVAQRRRG